MEQLINDIYEIIQDYRQEEGRMSVNRIRRWINQFPPTDREFILTELRSILAKRYFSKTKTVKLLEGLFSYVAKQLGFRNSAEFLRECSFIDHQPIGKSQKDFLALLREISQSKFELNLTNHNPTNPRYFIYLDDMLCTGDTLFKGLARVEGNERRGWLYQNINGSTHLDYLVENDAKIILLYLVIHKHNYSTFKRRLENELGEDLSNHLAGYTFKIVENDFRNENSKLDYLFPTIDNQPQNILDYAANLNVENNLGVFRPANLPIEESFFTSRENRIRFENIMLHQGMRLYELAGPRRNDRMRPLGYGLPSHRNLGFGTLCFTYRNVPFNTPLVFWYQYHNWLPLFERRFVNYGN